MSGIGDWGSLESPITAPAHPNRNFGREASDCGDGSAFAAAPAEDDSDAGREVYVCDLEPYLTAEELGALLGQYGEISNLERVVGKNGVPISDKAEREECGEQHDEEDEVFEAAVHCLYKNIEAASEAAEMLNHGSIRGRSCRCIPARALEVVRRTMTGGNQRLFVEGIDVAIESRGLLDLGALFGEVLDCKVEAARSSSAVAPDVSVEKPGSVATSVGFIHFEKAEEAKKALAILDGMQIGESVFKVRPFESKDLGHFTGCLYTAGCFDSPENGHEATPPLPEHVQEREAEGLDRFRHLQYHYLEVLDDRGLKLERLKTLVELYGPNQDQQMIVVAQKDSLEEISGVLRQCCEDVDLATASTETSASDLEAIVREYDTGNIFVLMAEPDVVTSKDFELGEPAAALVWFDLPETLPEYLYGILRRSSVESRVHGFLAPAEAKQALVDRLLSAHEEARHEMEPRLMEMCYARNVRSG